jgi:UDP-N-acetylmuramoylalanine--D-glutamate ligase
LFPLPRLKGRSVRVVGLGPAGRAAVRALSASGADVTVWDDDAAARRLVDLPAKGPRASLEEVHAVLLCEGISSQGAKTILGRAKAAKIPVLTDLDLFAEAIRAMPEEKRPTLTGITGAAGKSVTAALVGRVLDTAGRHAVIGGSSERPVLSLEGPQDDTTYVLELPIGRLAASRRLRCDVSVMLNLGDSMQAEGLDPALRAVMRLMGSHKPGDAAIIGVDDGVGQKVCTALQSGHAGIASKARVIPVSGDAALGHGVFALGSRAYSSQDGRTQPLGDFSRADALTPRHMRQNAAAAIAACLSLDIPPPLIIKALHGYKCLEGRFEPIGSKGRVLFVDDSRARCARSVELSVASCPDVFWIGQAKGKAVGRIAAQKDNLRGAYLVGGEDGMEWASGHPTLDEAVSRAFRDASAFADADPAKAPVVLYSPGDTVEPNAFRRLVTDELSENARHG